MRTGTTLVIGLATLLPAGLSAQNLRLDLIPGAGYHNPREDVGAATLIGAAWYVRLARPDESATFGASADISGQDHWLGARITGFITLPAEASASFHCRPGLACPDILMESEGEITTANLLADLVVELWDDRRVRPWLAAGGGLRHYDISWGAPAAFLDAGSHSETIPVLHAAVGFDVRVGPGAFRADIGGLWSAKGEPVPPAANLSFPVPSEPGRLAQRDFLISLGWRIARF